MKTEIGSLKKTQTEIKLETENLRSQINTSGKPHQQHTRDGRITDANDKVEEIDISAKTNVKPKKLQAQNSKEIWDTMKRQNLGIIGIEEEETQAKGTENRRKLP